MKAFLKKLRIRDYVTAILLALFLVCLALFFKVSGTLGSMDAARVFAGEGDMRFVQIASFFREDSAITQDTVLSFRRSLEKAMTDASLTAPEKGSLYKDAYSGSGKVTITTEQGSLQVMTVGVGGDFFLFHPLRLRSGSYVSESDLMQDRVVLDEELAWSLFGSYDVAGMCITVGGSQYVIAGVVSREDDFATTAAYEDGAGMFMCFDSFYDITGRGATCYEMVLPDMVSGYGMGLVESNFPVMMADCVENSSRYSLGSLFRVAKDFGLRSMRSDGVIYPYWENAIRLTEDYLALLLVVMLLLVVYPVVRAIVFVISTIVKTYRRAKEKIPAKVERMIEEKKEREYEKAGVD